MEFGPLAIEAGERLGQLVPLAHDRLDLRGQRLERRGIGRAGRLGLAGFLGGRAALDPRRRVRTSVRSSARLGLRLKQRALAMSNLHLETIHAAPTRQ